MVTADDIRKDVEAIRAVRDDDEMAHSLEDSLHEWVLELIANGAEKVVCIMPSDWLAQWEKVREDSGFAITTEPLHAHECKECESVWLHANDECEADPSPVPDEMTCPVCDANPKEA